MAQEHAHPTAPDVATASPPTSSVAGLAALRIGAQRAGLTSGLPGLTRAARRDYGMKLSSVGASPFDVARICGVTVPTAQGWAHRHVSEGGELG